MASPSSGFSLSDDFAADRKYSPAYRVRFTVTALICVKLSSMLSSEFPP